MSFFRRLFKSSNARIFKWNELPRDIKRQVLIRLIDCSSPERVRRDMRSLALVCKEFYSILRERATHITMDIKFPLMIGKKIDNRVTNIWNRYFVIGVSGSMLLVDFGYKEIISALNIIAVGRFLVVIDRCITIYQNSLDSIAHIMYSGKSDIYFDRPMKFIDASIGLVINQSESYWLLKNFYLELLFVDDPMFVTYNGGYTATGEFIRWKGLMVPKYRRNLGHPSIVDVVSTGTDVDIIVRNANISEISRGSSMVIFAYNTITDSVLWSKDMNIIYDGCYSVSDHVIINNMDIHHLRDLYSGNLLYYVVTEFRILGIIKEEGQFVVYHG